MFEYRGQSQILARQLLSLDLEMWRVLRRLGSCCEVPLHIRKVLHRDIIPSATTLLALLGLILLCLLLLGTIDVHSKLAEIDTKISQVEKIRKFLIPVGYSVGPQGRVDVTAHGEAPLADQGSQPSNLGTSDVYRRVLRIRSPAVGC